MLDITNLNHISVETKIRLHTLKVVLIMSYGLTMVREHPTIWQFWRKKIRQSTS
jgi:hypothetical protein